MVRHTLTILQYFLQDFQNLPNHFLTLYIKGLSVNIVLGTCKYFLQAIREGKDLDELQKKQEREREALEAMFDAEEAEQAAEIGKKLNEEHKHAIRQAHRDFLSEVWNLIRQRHSLKTFNF